MNEIEIEELYPNDLITGKVLEYNDEVVAELLRELGYEDWYVRTIYFINEYLSNASGCYGWITLYAQSVWISGTNRAIWGDSMLDIEQDFGVILFVIMMIIISTTV